MAVGKPAPIPAMDISVASAACREALEATVAKFTAVCEEVNSATIRRRMKKATVALAPTSTAFLPTNGEIKVKVRKNKLAATARQDVEI